MPLIDNVLINYRYSKEIEIFLNTLRDKTCRRTPSESIFDELYGILPPTKVVWNKDSIYNNEWELDGIITLTNEWNQLEMNLWYSGRHWYCVRISIFGSVSEAELAPSFNQDTYKEIFMLSNDVLEFLRSAFGCQMLKHTAIRKYIYDWQENAMTPDKNDMMTEIFVTLLNLKLQNDEQFNQDLFVKRAERIVYHIVTERSKYCVAEDCRELARTCAGRGVYKLADELYFPINLIWGFLANEPFMHQNESEESPYFYVENYYPDRRVEITPLLSASPYDRTGIIFHRNHDSYKQVFPDYETALRFHRIAREILQAIGGII
jgi:hypothetical protein